MSFIGLLMMVFGFFTLPIGIIPIAIGIYMVYKGTCQQEERKKMIEEREIKECQKREDWIRKNLYK